jgi:hypothetical protein
MATPAKCVGLPMFLWPPGNAHRMVRWLVKNVGRGVRRSLRVKYVRRHPTYLMSHGSSTKPPQPATWLGFKYANYN